MFLSVAIPCWIFKLELDLLFDMDAFETGFDSESNGLGLTVLSTVLSKLKIIILNHSFRIYLHFYAVNNLIGWK